MMAVFAADDFSKCTIADFSFSLKSMDLILSGSRKLTASAPFCHLQSIKHKGYTYFPQNLKDWASVKDLKRSHKLFTYVKKSCNCFSVVVGAISDTCIQ